VRVREASTCTNGLEHLLEAVGRDSASGVVDGDRHIVTARLARELHAPAALGELHRVREQVEHDLLHLLAVAARAQRRVAAAPAEGELAGTGLGRGERLARRQRLGHGHGLHRVPHRARLDPAVVQHPVDEPEQVPLAGPDAAEVRPLLLGEGAADPELHQLGVAVDGVERGAQLVAHDGEKLALRAVRRLGVGSRPLGFRPRPSAAVQRRSASRRARTESVTSVPTPTIPTTVESASVSG
jgi:hypothetical protein